MILVIGAGVAGLTAARVAHAAGAAVTVVTAGTLAFGDACSTAMAQGGIAAALAPGDSARAHLDDTMAAGAGLVDVEAARALVTDGAADVRHLIAEGFAPDRGPAGEVALGLEGAHGAHRIVHAGGDRTGAVMHAHLVAHLPVGVRVIEHAVLDRLIVDQGVVVGAELRREDGEGLEGAPGERIHADAVVLATGGYSALYDRTSNHAGARGDGIGAAAEVGAVVADLEFVQFHPTVLAGTGALISEAVRGAGAVLLDGAGSRFMQGRHPAADLASRDIVSREIHRVLRDTGSDRVWLDARSIETEHGQGSLARLFPGIDAALRRHGYEWAAEPVPVAPAAHYTMGGVATDLEGRSSVPGLFVAGEAAGTGVHGANRLASNSLLEGLVFGRRAAEAAVRFVADRSWELSGAALPRLLARVEIVGQKGARAGSACAGSVRSTGGTPQSVGRMLSQELGIEREAAGMTSALDAFGAVPGRDARLAELIAYAALARTESRGAHQRADTPATDPAQALRRAWRLATVSPGVAAPTGAAARNHSSHTTPARRSFAPC
ncbi:L-aspartate oxidase [Leucobacter salsicius]|uniref:L-aspartate oxidase n=1 Tax=Leucobacter salsicius TaxID=664638 RepID=UPI00034B90CE|nr:FAD-binding protein [Leucobacter salsicius]